MDPERLAIFEDHGFFSSSSDSSNREPALVINSTSENNGSTVQCLALTYSHLECPGTITHFGKHKNQIIAQGLLTL